MLITFTAKRFHHCFACVFYLLTLVWRHDTCIVVMLHQYAHPRTQTPSCVTNLPNLPYLPMLITCTAKRFHHCFACVCYLLTLVWRHDTCIVVMLHQHAHYYTTAPFCVTNLPNLPYLPMLITCTAKRFYHCFACVCYLL